MDYRDACAILGVAPGTEYREARAKYRALVKIFHVDRLGVDASDDANEQLVRINLAWEVFRKGGGSSGAESSDESNSSSNSKTSNFSIVERPPGADECIQCGSTPAKYASFRAVSGLLLSVRTAEQRGAFCRGCAEAVHQFCQQICWQGFWGISAFPALVALNSNRSALRGFRNQPNGSYRYAGVATPFRTPLAKQEQDKSWILSPILATFVWAFVVLVATAAIASNSGKSTQPGARSETTTQMTEAELVGSCLEEDNPTQELFFVSCDSASAEYVIRKVVLSKDLCSGYYIPLRFPIPPERRYACISGVK